MSLRLALSRLYLPAVIRKRKLTELVHLTARAFDAVPPSLEGLSLDGMLRLFAEYSSEMAERARSRPEGLAEVERRLFGEASRMGREIRRELGVNTPGEAMAAARVLYRSLKIDFRGGPGGDVAIRRCFFSRFYSPTTCRLMSSLDAGVLAGLAGGGGLEFVERITEGSGCCRARFSFPKAGS